MKASRLAFLEAALADLEREGLLRVSRPREDLPAGSVALCSNDYLGLGARPLAPSEMESGGAGASALVWGWSSAHDRAERRLAAFVGSGAALLFSSGYAANVGLLTALAGRGDVIVSDALNHASIIDGCRMSGARIVVTPHLDLDAVRLALHDAASARRRFVVTESVFSMDGDGPDLRRLRSCCDDLDAALIVDEAHALGVVGPGGRGRLHADGVGADAMVGTLGKAFGLSGAFVAGSASLRTWLWNRARSFVFSTAMPPGRAAAIEARVDEVEAADEARAHLAALAAAFRARVAEHLGAPPPGDGVIIPLVIGPARAAVEVSRSLLAQGWVVQAMRPPTVPAGTSRLRITLRADLDRSTVLRAADAIGRAVAGARGP